MLVYAGIDPLTGKPHYLTESTSTEAQAQRVLTRLLTQVDGQRNARTKATLGTALDSWLRVHEIEETTRPAYEGYIRLYIRPAIGHVSMGKVAAQVLEEFYAELRRCRVRRNGRPAVEHRTTDPHECRQVRHRRRPGRPSQRSEEEHDCAALGCVAVECKPQTCRPLSASTIRQVHSTISAALADRTLT